MAKTTIADIFDKKRRGEKITQVTAYDFPVAQLVDEAGIDMILVGDSVGMVVLGYENPIPVTVEDIIHHTRPVARGAKKAFIVGDLPYLTYHINVEDAIRNSGRIIQEGGADAVKLEGGIEIVDKVEALVDVGIPVQGHIGLMPQRATVLGGINVQGATAESAAVVLKDAVALEEAGAFSVVLEYVAAEAAEVITERLNIPTIGVGAGPHCDGQVLVVHDVFGVYENPPPFARKFADLRGAMLDALKGYESDVKAGGFPGKEQTFLMEPGEKKKLDKLLDKV
jgi:3-methyl-2-oxobutanoate hydroxymethyltransferase